MLGALDPANGSHWDVLVTVPIIVLVLYWYLSRARKQKRLRMEGYEDRRYAFKEELRGMMEWDEESKLYVPRPQINVAKASLDLGTISDERKMEWGRNYIARTYSGSAWEAHCPMPYDHDNHV